MASEEVDPLNVIFLGSPIVMPRAQSLPYPVGKLRGTGRLRDRLTSAIAAITMATVPLRRFTDESRRKENGSDA